MQTLIVSRLLLFSVCLSTLSLQARTQAPAGTTAKPVLLVANQTDHDISIIDPAEARQIAVVPEDGITGHEVAVTPDGHTAFVPIYGDSGVGRPGTDGSFMDVIDIASHRVTGKVDFGHGVRPHYPLYDPISRLLYVTTELDKTVTIVNPRTLKIVGSIPTAQEESHMLAISHDGRRGYTSNVGPGTVSVLDLTARKTIAVIPVSNKTQRISISNDDRMVFTADQTKPRLALIDTSTDKITAWVPLPAMGYGTASTKDGRWLLVALPSIDKVAVLDLKERKVARTIDVPKSPTEILASPDGTAAYVSCGHSHQVAVIDVSQWKVRTLIDAGQGADGMAWSR
jgi:DNA-binding beta-propeller fold protein YncE